MINPSRVTAVVSSRVIAEDEATAVVGAGFEGGRSLAFVVRRRATFEETRGSCSSVEERRQSAYNQSCEIIDAVDGMIADATPHTKRVCSAGHW